MATDGGVMTGSQDSSLDESNESEGYDNEFLILEHGYDCPICTMCLRDPYQTDCGHRFCRNCITRWLRLNSREVKCPSCNDMLTSERIYPDNFAKREVQSLEAKCVYSLQGCTEQSSLKAILRHQASCPYRPVICPNNCHEEVMAKDLDEHVAKTCSKIMVSCKLCQHQVPLSNLENHQNKCSTANAACPYCGEPIDQSNGDSQEGERRHTCTSNNIIQCRFTRFGCKFTCPAVDMKHHMEQCQQEHLLSLAICVERMSEDPRPALDDLKELESRMSSMLPVGAMSGASESLVKPADLSQYHEDDLKKPKLQRDGSFADASVLPERNGGYTTSMYNSGEYVIGAAEAETTMQLRNQISNQQQHILELRSKVNYLENSLQDIKSDLRDARNEMKNRNCQGTYIWRLKNYSKLRVDAKRGAPNCVIHSQGFFTSFNGYQFCIRLNLNGVENAQGTHLSLFIHLMQSENDDILTWPFTGKITLTICDQQSQPSKRNPITETLVAKPGLAAFQRPNSYRNHKGFGYMEFAPISYLESEDRCFIKNDMLLIKAEVKPSPAL